MPSRAAPAPAATPSSSTPTPSPPLRLLREQGAPACQGAAGPCPGRAQRQGSPPHSESSCWRASEGWGQQGRLLLLLQGLPGPPAAAAGEGGWAVEASGGAPLQLQLLRLQSAAHGALGGHCPAAQSHGPGLGAQSQSAGLRGRRPLGRLQPRECACHTQTWRHSKGPSHWAPWGACKVRGPLGAQVRKLCSVQKGAPAASWPLPPDVF